jgi:uncharacterized protein YgiM (DUF1202 family)
MASYYSKLSIIGAALISLGLGIVPVAMDAAHAQEANVFEPPQAAPLLAQVDDCRAVVSDVRGLNVRQSPSATADVLGVVPGGAEVTLENLGANGWVPISEPYSGYVSARYLTPCGSFDPDYVATAPAVTDTNTELCQEVIVRSGLNVRAQPTVYSTRLGALPTGTQVVVDGPEANNWVPISEPMDGYVAARFLGDC